MTVELIFEKFCSQHCSGRERVRILKSRLYIDCILKIASRTLRVNESRTLDINESRTVAAESAREFSKVGCIVIVYGKLPRELYKLMSHELYSELYI